MLSFFYIAGKLEKCLENFFSSASVVIKNIFNAEILIALIKTKLFSITKFTKSTTVSV